MLHVSESKVKADLVFQQNYCYIVDARTRADSVELNHFNYVVDPQMSVLKCNAIKCH